MSQALRLLVVDDEQEVTQSLKEQLEFQGYVVQTADNGIAALEAVKTEIPHLILLDLMLPTLDGYRVLKLLKSHQLWSRIPVFVITARADEEDWTLALECGADACLTKPVRFDTLLERIRAQLERIPGMGDGHVKK